MQNKDIALMGRHDKPPPPSAGRWARFFAVTTGRDLLSLKIILRDHEWVL